MAIDQVRKGGLWTPEGVVDLGKDQQAITREDLIILARFHEFAQKHKIEVRCMRCGASFTGNNNDASIAKGSASVACRCRELIYRRI
jgi:hypothetical protein